MTPTYDQLCINTALGLDSNDSYVVSFSIQHLSALYANVTRSLHAMHTLHYLMAIYYDYFWLTNVTFCIDQHAVSVCLLEVYTQSSSAEIYRVQSMPSPCSYSVCTTCKTNVVLVHRHTVATD